MSEGRKDDGGKLRMDLLAPEALRGVAEVLTYGASKYDDRNWEAGIKWGRVYAALLRHLTSWWGGEELDEESGKHHLDHAGCCIHFLQTYRHTRPEFDDRPGTRPDYMIDTDEWRVTEGTGNPLRMTKACTDIEEQLRTQRILVQSGETVTTKFEGTTY